jgi:nucleoside phosphorylase
MFSERRLAPFPDIAGQWVMEISWTHNGRSGQLEADAFIRQNGEGVAMTVRSPGSDSHTLMVQPGRDATGDPLLYYLYEVDPKASQSDAPGPYKGAAILRYYAQSHELSGNYWTSQRSCGHFKMLRKEDRMTESMSVSVDVILITAISEEHDAARETLSAVELDGDGVRDWQTIEPVLNAPCDRGVYFHGGKPLFTVAMARSARMGAIDTGQLAVRLIDHLKPGWVVMCGVCAGNPADLALGDVVISSLTYQFDEGKLEKERQVPDHRQSPVEEQWVRAASELKASAMSSFGKPSLRDQRYWLLERLYGGADPRKHPARLRYFAEAEWAPMVEALERENVIKIVGTSLALTQAGKKEVERSIVFDVDPPKQLPFAIKVGPIASGNVVVKDGLTWDKLTEWGVRSVLGLEMEGAAIGRAARSAGVSNWIVVKGVMDHADPNKDDRYKPFAARASAEVLRAFLIGRFVTLASMPAGVGPAPSPTRAVPMVSAQSMPTQWRPHAIDGAFFDMLREAVTTHAENFAGLFDLALDAARQARDHSMQARERSDTVRIALGSAIANAHAGKLSKQPLVIKASAPPEARALIAKIWNSHDEYLGEAAGDVADGLGVLRAYEMSEELTPHMQSEYAGQLQAGNYGPLGVFTFPDQSHFAGRWASGHPQFGYREYLGSKTKLGCDFYLGSMRGVANFRTPFWHPHGQGIAVNVGRRHVRCGMLDDGQFQTVEFDFAF